MNVSTRITTPIAAEIAFWLWVVVAELLLVIGYFAFTSAEPTTLRYALYPFVWINVGCWSVLRTTPAPPDRRSRWLAVGIAVAYFIALAAVAGLIGIRAPSGLNQSAGFRVVMASPGWGPAVAYTASSAYLVLVPYLVIGYGSLAYLVYATVLEAAEAAVSGLLGLASCVGCAFPVIASLVAGLAGGSSALTAAVYAFSIDISTAVFVLAVGLLYWRPGFDRYDSRR